MVFILDNIKLHTSQFGKSSFTHDMI